MATNELSRRTFIKGTIGAAAALAVSPVFTACETYDAKGLPTVILGKTGVRIPRIAVGLGSRYCTISEEDKALELLNFALDNGFYYWDTAHTYVNNQNGVVSEERLGKVVALRRNEIFLSTKVAARKPDEAKRQIELSLKRLQTDHLDMLKIHSVTDIADVDDLSKKGNLIELVHRMKEEGVTRFIGFSGHSDAEALKAMTERGEFDSMLMAMNHYNASSNAQERQELVIPAARARGMGVMIMKTVRPKELIENINITDLIRYALSLEGPHGLVVGMDSLAVVKSNLELLKNFTPMNESEMKTMAQQLTPFYHHQKLPWMNPGYHDGQWT